MRPDDGAGRGARSPFQVPAQGWLAVLKRTWAETGEDNIGLIAAGIAFYAFAAIVPMLGAVVLSYGLFADADTVRRNVESVFEAVPREAATLITEQLLAVVESSGDKQGIGLIVAIAIAYYGATKGATAIMTGLNIAYDGEERRGIVRTTLLSLGIVGGGVTMILVAGLTTTLLALLASLIPGAPWIVLVAIRVGGYLALATLVVTGAALLFHFGPDRDQPRWTWLSPGALGATLLWLAGTSLFGLYVSNFGNYGATYGSLSAVVVLLTWLWLTAYLFLIGAELNAELERQADGTAAAGAPLEEEVADAAQPAAGASRARPMIVGAVAGGLAATAGLVVLRHARLIGAGLMTVAVIRRWRRPG